MVQTSHSVWQQNMHKQIGYKLTPKKQAQIGRFNSVLQETSWLSWENQNIIEICDKINVKDYPSSNSLNFQMRLLDIVSQHTKDLSSNEFCLHVKECVKNTKLILSMSLSYQMKWCNENQGQVLQDKTIEVFFSSLTRLKKPNESPKKKKKTVNITST